jgi:cyclase
MNRTLLVRVSAAALMFVGAWAAYTQQGKQPNNKLNKITDDLYEIEGDGGNVAIYITNEGAILVDDKFDYDYDDIMAKVKSVTNQPVKYVMSTHHHGDHTGSSARFLPTAEVIAHKNNRMNMVKGKQPGVPRVVFEKEASVFLGGKEVRAIYFGRGHTNGDVMIYFPALRVLHTGDLFAGATPLIDYSNGGSLKEWPATLDAALKMDFDTVIPGHGPVSHKADLQKYRENLANFTQRISQEIKGGKPKDAVAKVLQSEFGWDPQGLQMRVGLDGLMTELKN